ncbi:MAG: right-handed parallel beta-helix repeat-containing protein, partial [Bacteroidales bacterium]|nr:right-handed parallel beta-helix repeat-containing protein [Bacteroidales bacterium]
MKKMITLVLGIMLVGGVEATVYVVPGGTGDGSSWSNALGDIQSAVNAAQVLFSTSSEAQDVWVKAGTYSTAAAPVLMKEGVNLYGGFAGTETELSQRARGTDPWDFTHVTILDGGAAKRCIEVAANFPAVYVIDGFTITNGNGQGTQLNNSGGGVLLRANLKLQNSIVTGNTTTGNGGGINAVGGIVSNCRIYNNTTTSGTIPAAGGIYAAPASGFASLIEHSLIEQNAQGGVRVQAAGNSTLNSLIIRNNTSTGAGAGIYTNNP